MANTKSTSNQLQYTRAIVQTEIAQTEICVNILDCVLNILTIVNQV